MPTATRRCTGCKERFRSETMISINAGKFHSFDCATGYATAKSAKLREKTKKQKAQLQRKDLKARKDALKTRGEWLKDLQTAFNLFTRLRDHEQPCISCGRYDHEIENKYLGGKWDAGHFCSIGSAPEKRFFEDNVHKQCKHCNSWLSGNNVEYRKLLLERIGEERLAVVEGPHEALKLSIEDIKGMLKDYRAKARQLKREIEG